MKVKTKNGNKSKVDRAREAKVKLEPPLPPPPSWTSVWESRAAKDKALAELYRELARCARNVQELLDIVIDQERES